MLRDAQQLGRASVRLESAFTGRGEGRLLDLHLYGDTGVLLSRSGSRERGIGDTRLTYPSRRLADRATDQKIGQHVCLSDGLYDTMSYRYTLRDAIAADCDKVCPSSGGRARQTTEP